jgi:hypothetical protein
VPTAPAHSAPLAIGLSTINGLPAHILLVHAVVVFVPLSALSLIAAVTRPSAAQRLGVWRPAVSVVALVSVLAAMNAGGWLQNHVANTELVRDHTRIAGQLWPFSAAVALLSILVWHFKARATAPDAALGHQGGGMSLTVIVAILSVAVALGSIVQVVRIGDSGSRAAWHNHFSQNQSDPAQSKAPATGGWPTT